MPTEAAAQIVDLVVAELVDCTPEPAPAVTVVLPEVPARSPTERASDATIAQTGAQPPPAVSRVQTFLSQPIAI